jgi:hypothetical protein
MEQDDERIAELEQDNRALRGAIAALLRFDGGEDESEPVPVVVHVRLEPAASSRSTAAA